MGFVSPPFPKLVLVNRGPGACEYCWRPLPDERNEEITCRGCGAPLPSDPDPSDLPSGGTSSTGGR